MEGPSDVRHILQERKKKINLLPGEWKKISWALSEIRWAFSSFPSLPLSLPPPRVFKVEMTDLQYLCPSYGTLQLITLDKAYEASQSNFMLSYTVWILWLSVSE